MRPSNRFRTAIYPASSSFLAWTLRLPSVAPSSSLSSLNESDSLTASALTSASRSRSWIRRSSSIGLPSWPPVTLCRPRGSSGASRRCAALRPLATVPPRDDRPEHDVEQPEAAGQERVAPFPRRVQGHGPDRHEAESHEGHGTHREGAAGHDAGAVEQEPEAGKLVAPADLVKARR